MMLRTLCSRATVHVPALLLLVPILAGLSGCRSEEEDTSQAVLSEGGQRMIAAVERGASGAGERPVELTQVGSDAEGFHIMLWLDPFAPGDPEEKRQVSPWGQEIVVRTYRGRHPATLTGCSLVYMPLTRQQVDHPVAGAPPLLDQLVTGVVPELGRETGRRAVTVGRFAGLEVDVTGAEPSSARQHRMRVVRAGYRLFMARAGWPVGGDDSEARRCLESLRLADDADRADPRGLDAWSWWPGPYEGFEVNLPGGAPEWIEGVVPFFGRERGIKNYAVQYAHPPATYEVVASALDDAERARPAETLLAAWQAEVLAGRKLVKREERRTLGGSGLLLVTTAAPPDETLAAPRWTFGLVHDGHVYELVYQPQGPGATDLEGERLLGLRALSR